MDELVVTRDVELDLTAAELWALVADGEAWPEWLATEADVVVEPGCEGTVVDDDGRVRRVAIERADPESGVRFRWWPETEPEAASLVEFRVVEQPRGSRLQIRETFPLLTLEASGVTMASAAVVRWDVCTVSVWLRSLTRLPA